MTELLEMAFAGVKKAPSEVQDAIGQLVLAELQDELRWQADFDQTSDAQWDRLAERIRKEIASGETDSLFKTKTPYEATPSPPSRPVLPQPRLPAPGSAS